ncbi:MAG: anaerobic ribonucleoside-triphosphate reductase [Nanoarchaeota archaeon]|nr:anaerobic ribonucleoside-triphosphate reductase [Nanoarchaeota archaeon]
MESCNKKCEVYSRIVGYYRPVDHWNAGKKEEFKDRFEYSEEKGLNNEFSANNAKTENESAMVNQEIGNSMEFGPIQKYKVFSLPNCSKCEAVKAHLATVSAMTGSETSLGADDGVKEFRQYYKDIKDRVKRNEDGSLPIPTVLFFDANENIVGTAHDVDQVKLLMN